jgi:hypothetical protein
MDFRVELADQARRDIDAIYDWLRLQQAGDAGELVRSAPSRHLVSDESSGAVPAGSRESRLTD